MYNGLFLIDVPFIYAWIFPVCVYVDNAPSIIGNSLIQLKVGLHSIASVMLSKLYVHWNVIILECHVYVYLVILNVSLDYVIYVQVITNESSGLCLSTCSLTMRYLDNCL